MSNMRNRGCGCAGGGPLVRIVKGNDFTVVALASVYDEEKGMYIPFGLAEATDVELNIVGLYGKVPGKDIEVDGNSVSARFSGAVGAGKYGVEILFRDSEGRGRIFERNLFEVVGSSGEATLESSSEGETGDGHNVSVDVRTRTVRVGKSTGVTDYNLLDNKPSIGGVTLEGDKSLTDLGCESPVFVVSIDIENPNDDGSYNMTHTPAEIHQAHLAGKIVVLDITNVNLRWYLQTSSESGGIFRCDYTFNTGEKDEPYSSWLRYDTSGLKDFGEAYSVFSFAEQRKLRYIEAQAQVNTIEHILVGDKEYEPKTVGTKKKAVCLPEILSTLINSGDGTKFLNDKGEYADPVAGVKSSVEGLAPYDCSWAWRLNQGDEAPADKVRELELAIQAKRALFYRHVNSDGDSTINLGISAYYSDEDTTIALYKYNNLIGSLFRLVIDSETSDDYKYSVSIKGILSFQEKLVSGTNIKTVNGQSLLGAGDIVTDKAVISPLPDVFGGTSAEFFANLKELYDAGTLKLNCIYYGNTEITDIVAGLAVQEMRVEVLPGDGGQVVFSAVATTSTYDDSLKPFRWETQSLNGGFSKWVGRATQDSIPTKVSQLSNDAGYLKADTPETITDASEISVTCESGRTHQGNNIMTLAVGCSATDDSKAVEERIVFSTGSSVESITVTGVSWANGDTPSFKGNKVYEINISFVPLLGKFLATYAEY